VAFFGYVRALDDISHVHLIIINTDELLTMNIKNKSRATWLKSIWIIIASIFYTGSTCIRSVVRGLIGTNNRQWVNQELKNWIKRIFKLFRIEYTVINPLGVEPKPGQMTIIMCNHSSLLDIPIGLCAFPNHTVRILAKKEMEHIPFMKQGLKTAEFPTVDRKNRKQAIQDLEEVSRLLKSGVVMWIFPEGTRSHDGQVRPLKKGGFITAIQTQATIIPLGIRGAFSILPARTLHFNLGQHAEIHVGQPIDASLYTLENKEELIHTVYESMRNLAGDT